MTDNLIKKLYMQRNLKNVARKLKAVASMMENKATEFEDINILLIEDNTVDIQMFKFYLSKLGNYFNVMNINNGLEAEKFLTMKDIPHPDFVPDIIILDLSLPGVNGTDILDIILREQYLQWLPVIVTSGSIDIPMREEYENKGLIFLKKPYSKEQLLEAMSKKLCLTLVA